MHEYRYAVYSGGANQYAVYENNLSEAEVARLSTWFGKNILAADGVNPSTGVRFAPYGEKESMLSVVFRNVNCTAETRSHFASYNVIFDKQQADAFFADNVARQINRIILDAAKTLEKRGYRLPAPLQFNTQVADTFTRDTKTSLMAGLFLCLGGQTNDTMFIGNGAPAEGADALWWLMELLPSRLRKYLRFYIGIADTAEINNTPLVFIEQQALQHMVDRSDYGNAPMGKRYSTVDGRYISKVQLPPACLEVAGKSENFFMQAKELFEDFDAAKAYGNFVLQVTEPFTFQTVLTHCGDEIAAACFTKNGEALIHDPAIMALDKRACPLTHKAVENYLLADPTGNFTLILQLCGDASAADCFDKNSAALAGDPAVLALDKQVYPLTCRAIERYLLLDPIRNFALILQFCGDEVAAAGFAKNGEALMDNPAIAALDKEVYPLTHQAIENYLVANPTGNFALILQLCGDEIAADCFAKNGETLIGDPAITALDTEAYPLTHKAVEKYLKKTAPKAPLQNRTGKLPWLITAVICLLLYPLSVYLGLKYGLRAPFDSKSGTLTIQLDPEAANFMVQSIVSALIHLPLGYLLIHSLHKLFTKK